MKNNFPNLEKLIPLWRAIESSHRLVDHLPPVVDVVDDDDDDDDDVAVVLYVYINNNIRKKDLLWHFYKEAIVITHNNWGHLFFSSHSSLECNRYETEW